MKAAGALALSSAVVLLAAAPGKLIPVTDHQKLVAENRGKVLLINYWATWCAPCRAEMPQLVKMEAALRDKGFRLVTVSADEPEQEGDAFNFLAKNHVPLPAYIRKSADDDKYINAVDPKWSGALPASFLYDRNGRKVKSYFGETNLQEMEAAIRKLL